MAQESALWFFVGRNSGDDALPGRPPHTDEVKHDGTYHRQLSGCKEWRVRPTEELLARGRRSMASTSRGRSRKRSRAAAAEEEEGAEEDDEGSGEWRIVRCEAGDVLAISTRDWWHSTSLPPQAGVSVSVAREWNVRGATRPRRTRASGRSAAAALEGDGEADDGRATSFTNVDGLFATRAIARGCVILTEDDSPDMELPEVDAARANCEVAEDEETGKMCLVARRAIRSGEFLSVAAD